MVVIYLANSKLNDFRVFYGVFYTCFYNISINMSIYDFISSYQLTSILRSSRVNLYFCKFNSLLHIYEQFSSHILIESGTNRCRHYFIKRVNSIYESIAQDESLFSLTHSTINLQTFVQDIFTINTSHIRASGVPL